MRGRGRRRGERVRECPRAGGTEQGRMDRSALRTFATRTQETVCQRAGEAEQACVCGCARRAPVGVLPGDTQTVCVLPRLGERKRWTNHQTNHQRIREGERKRGRERERGEREREMEGRERGRERERESLSDGERYRQECRCRDSEEGMERGRKREWKRTIETKTGVVSLVER